MKVTVPEGIMFQDLGGESVLLNLQNDKYFGLDDIGTRMWALLAEHGDVEKVTDDLHAQFGTQVDRATLKSDLLELIQKLEAKSLLKVQR